MNGWDVTTMFTQNRTKRPPGFRATTIMAVSATSQRTNAAPIVTYGSITEFCI